MPKTKPPVIPAFLRAPARPISRPAPPSPKAMWCSRCSTWKESKLDFTLSQANEREDLRACMECQRRARAALNARRSAKLAVARAFPAEEIAGAQERLRAASGGSLRGMRLAAAAESLLRALPTATCCLCGGSIGEHYRVLPGEVTPPFGLACFICFAIVRSGMDRKTLALHYAEIRQRALAERPSDPEDEPRDYALSGV